MVKLRKALLGKQFSFHCSKSAIEVNSLLVQLGTNWTGQLNYQVERKQSQHGWQVNLTEFRTRVQNATCHTEMAIEEDAEALLIKGVSYPSLLQAFVTLLFSSFMSVIMFRLIQLGATDNVVFLCIALAAVFSTTFLFIQLFVNIWRSREVITILNTYLNS